MCGPQTLAALHRNIKPWCKVTVEKEIRVDEEAEQVEMPSGEEAPRSTSPLRQIPRKEPPRFEEV